MISLNLVLFIGYDLKYTLKSVFDNHEKVYVEFVHVDSRQTYSSIATKLIYYWIPMDWFFVYVAFEFDLRFGNSKKLDSVFQFSYITNVYAV